MMSPRIAKKNLDLLVVDSKAEDYRDLSNEVQDANLNWKHANDGHHALQLSSGKNIRLWFSNMQLPDMSGIELLEIVRAKRPATLFYLVSDEYSAEEERQARAAGAAGYLSKPADHTWLEICCSTLARMRARASPQSRKDALGAAYSNPSILFPTHSHKDS